VIGSGIEWLDLKTGYTAEIKRLEWGWRAHFRVAGRIGHFGSLMNIEGQQNELNSSYKYA